ncbi:MAG: hypothetical protein SEPTF4163_003683 [Sporothrix epigloea]
MTAATAKGPNFLSAPSLNLNIRLHAAPPAAELAAGTVPPEDPNSDREARVQYIRELYGKLQSLYPGVDYTKEPAFTSQQASHAGSGGSISSNRGPGASSGPIGPVIPHTVNQGSPPLQRNSQMGLIQGSPGASGAPYVVPTV